MAEPWYTTELPPLAGPDDVKAVLGRDLTSEEQQRVVPILEKASELFRRRSGQQFTPGQSTVRLKSNGGEVRLPQRPVVTVTSVTRDDGTAVPYTLFGQVLTVPLGAHQFVRVSYTHGGVVPDVVRLCIAEIAKRVLSIDESAAAGATARMRVDGPFTTQESYAAWAVGGQTMLSPDDIALADTFNKKLGGTMVARPCR